MNRFDRAFPVARGVLGALLVLICVLGGVGRAQDRGTTADDFVMRNARPSKPTRPRSGPRRRPKARRAEAPAPGSAPNATAKLLVGDVLVDVKDPLAVVAIDVGLAKGGVGVIEFPASDPMYTISPADENLVTIDRLEGAEAKRTDPVIFRPGTLFRPPEAGVAASPAAQISIQMTSGLVLVVSVFPTKDLAHSITRVMVSYERATVVAARRSKGLAADLDVPVPREPERPEVAESRKPATTDNAEVLYNPAASRLRAGEPRLVAAVAVADRRLSLVGGRTPEEITHSELARAIAEPTKLLSKFSATSHGLQIAASSAREVDAKYRLVLLAVRNATKSDIRLTPGQPDVYIETSDGEGRPVNIEHLRKLRIETTAIERLVPASGIVYYAVLFEAPVLGARQQLRISVSPMFAADEPAIGAVPDVANQ